MAGLPAAGSVAFGAAWGATGLLFAAVGGITAQLSVSARAATGLGLIVLAVAYVARAVGDLAEGGPGWLSWLSPIGWSQQVRAFSGTRWGILVLPLVATAVLVVVAFVLRRRRDLGAGLLADRPGPAEGRLSSTWGLSLRLQRPVLPGVDGGGGPHGAGPGQRRGQRQRVHRHPGDGGVPGEAGRPPGPGRRLPGRGARDHRLAGGRLRDRGRALAAPPRRRAGAPRTCWPPRPRGASGRRAMRSWPSLGVAVLTVLVGLAIGLGHALSVGEPEQVWRLAVAATARIPAAWVMVGLAVAIWGFWPRLSGLVWVLFVAFLVMGEFGVLWDLPEWAAQPQPVRALAGGPRPRPAVPGHPGDAGRSPSGSSPSGSAGSPAGTS